MLGIDGPLKDFVAIGGGSSVPVLLQRGASRSISLVPAPGCRSGGEAGVTSLQVRCRILGIERISFLDLAGELRIRC